MSPHFNRHPAISSRRWSRSCVLVAGLSLIAGMAVPLTAAAEPRSPVATPELTELSVPASQPISGKKLAPTQDQSVGAVIAALPPRATGMFSTVGVTWAAGSGNTTVRVEVRLRQDQQWTDWKLLENEDASGPDGAEASRVRVGTAPTWVGSANGVGVRLLNGMSASPQDVPTDVKISLVNPKSASTDANPPTAPSPQQVPSTTNSRTSTASNSSLPYLYPAPAMVSRKGWGADERLRCNQAKIDKTVKAAIIHHTAGSNFYTRSQSASIVRGIYAYHTKSLGWCDIGYNFLVDKYGTIFEGRFGGIWNPVHGAHATLWNTNTVGISFMGNFETATPPGVMLQAGARLVAWKLEGNYRNATGKVSLAGKNINVISGHGDVMQTSCPGRNIRSRMGWFRANVKARIGSYNTPIYRRWQALGGEAGPAGSPFIGEHAKAGGRITNFTHYDIYWSRAAGAHWLKGANRSRYRAMKDVSSYLKWPVSDQEKGPLGSQRNRFSDGAIYWTAKTGSHDVYRAFYRFYAGLDAQALGSIGLPIASQQPGAIPGTQVQRFQHGGLYWISAVKKTQAVTGRIYTTYASLGAERSRLGMPTKGDYAISGGRATKFQHGKITWNSRTGAIKISYH